MADKEWQVLDAFPSVSGGFKLSVARPAGSIVSIPMTKLEVLALITNLANALAQAERKARS